MRYSKKTKTQVIDMYKGGMSKDAIADELGITYGYVKDIINGAGLKDPVVDVGKILALWKAGWDIASIMEDTGLTEDKIKEVIREYY